MPSVRPNDWQSAARAPASTARLRTRRMHCLVRRRCGQRHQHVIERRCRYPTPEPHGGGWGDLL